jgi:hypothetical protein
VRSGPGEAKTIQLLHIISVRSSKQPLMVRTFLKVYMELGSYFVSARTNKDMLKLRPLVRDCSLFYFIGYFFPRGFLSTPLPISNNVLTRSPHVPLASSHSLMTQGFASLLVIGHAPHALSDLTSR